MLSHPRSFVNVCFWWVPPALRPFQPAKASQQDLATLSKVGCREVCYAESARRACKWVLRVLLQHCSWVQVVDSCCCLVMLARPFVHWQSVHTFFAHGLTEIKPCKQTINTFMCNKSCGSICCDELAMLHLFITTIRFCGGNLCSDDGDMWLQVAPRIKDAMQQAGDAMIGFQPLQGLPNFFRIVFPSAWTVTTTDLDALMTRIEDFGNKLFPALQQ